MSTKQIKIGYYKVYGCKDYYTVISVKNTTEHLPGDQLSLQEVDRLCGSFHWDVTLVKLNAEKTA